MRRAGLVACIVLLAATAAVAEAQGCPMCRTALTQSPEGRALAESFNGAILLMLAAPYAVFSVCLAVIFRRRLRARLARLLRRFGLPRPACPRPLVTP